MNAWVTTLTPEQFQQLSELCLRTGQRPESLAVHLLEREHARVFAPDDDDEIIVPTGFAPPEKAAVCPRCRSAKTLS